MDFLKYSVDRLVRSTHGEKVDAIPEYIKKMPTNEIPNYILKIMEMKHLQRKQKNGD